MKKILYVAFIAALGASSLSSCSDFLEAENKTNKSANSYFSTEEGLSSLRVNAYYSLKTLVSQTDIYEWGTDLYIPTRGKEADAEVFNKYTLNAETDDVENYYEDTYSMINNANCLLYYGSNNAQYAAEAKFLRCYGYYLLTQQFGAVPYITEYIQDATTGYPRTELSEIYPALIEELESIKDDTNLPESDVNGNISRRAVNALLAKVCLAAGWDLQTTLVNATAGTYTINDNPTYFTKAYGYAIDAIGSQSLTMSFEDKWSPSNEHNAEEIFSVQYDRASYPGDVTKGGHGLQNEYGNYYGDCSASGYKYTTSMKALSEKALYLWDKGDERFDGTFMTTIYNYDGTWGTTGYYAYYNSSNTSTLPIGLRYFPYYVTEEEVETELSANADRYAKGNNVNDVYLYILSDPVIMYSYNSQTEQWEKSELTYSLCNEKSYGTTVVKKWDDPETSQISTNTTNDYRDIVIFHLSDMYLTAAEAYLMAGDKVNALKYINYVRTRANAVNINDFSEYDPEYSRSSELTEIDVILDERARELFAENQRWIDLRRTRQLVRYNIEFNSEITSVSEMSNTDGEIKWYRPIPATELNSNTAMTSDDQNPGY
ncbi:MAG: RagB/SusD family nutrient uptake outer membrane protein [Prevotellaceae bacterium]|nr:RagB/SusD family nutrient uptake outer membrane protein [Prevotellaceae bacterium]